jgi:hypothetical protein
MSSSDRRYGLFVQDTTRSLWKEFFGDLEEAKREAKKLADEERREYFVFDISHAVEVDRFYPPNSSAKPA